MREKIAGIEALASWFKRNKRSFPWRNDISPYRIWISEVMLQQTRAEVVIPYFLRWMERFPDIVTLARADEEDVIKTWEGLGYYARARRLLQGARYLVEKHEGKLPENPELLAKIPGFGPYTTGAVASFAFHLRAAAVDGNVLRFLSRYLALEKDIGRPSVQEEFRNETLRLLPEKEPWVVMEAMIELGATICKKTPLCAECPVASDCLAFSEGKAAKLPIKTRGPSIIRLTRQAALIECDGSILLHRVPHGRVMAGLYEFPAFDEETDLTRVLCLVGPLIPIARFDDIPYSFTRYQVTLKPFHYKASCQKDLSPYEWVSLEEIQKFSFSSGHRRLLQKFLQFRA